MYFIDLDGSYVFTLGLDTCEPPRHGTDMPRVVKVDNRNVYFLETVKCTSSNGMFFHEHRLVPEDTNNPELVARAVEQYCSQLQNSPTAPSHEQRQDEQQRQAIELPATFASSLQVMPERSTLSARDRSTRRLSPYPGTSSLLQRRTAPLRTESSTVSSASADAAPRTSTRKLTISTPEASRGAPGAMTQQGLLQSGRPARPLEQSASFIATQPAIPPTANPSRRASSQGISIPSTSGLSAPRANNKPVTEIDRAKIIDYCLKHHLGKTGFHAFSQLKYDFQNKKIDLDYMPSRSTIENILESAGHIRIEKPLDSHSRAIKTIIGAPEQEVQPVDNSGSASAQSVALPSTSGLSAARAGERYFTTEMTQKILDYCLTHHVGKTTYYAYNQLQKAFNQGKTQFDQMPSRSGLEKVLARAGHLTIERSASIRAIRTITRTPALQMPPPIQPQEEQTQPPENSSQDP